MVQYSMTYGWGDKEPDRIMAALGVITNVLDHLYYPCDKICWLIEQKIINSKNNELWDTINSVLWVASIYLNLMKWVSSLTVKPVPISYHVGDASVDHTWHSPLLSLIPNIYALIISKFQYLCSLMFSTNSYLFSVCWILQAITFGLIMSSGTHNAVSLSRSNKRVNYLIHRTVRLVHVMRIHRQQVCLDIDKLENESSISRLQAKEQMEQISIFRLSLDFVHAASTLPNGWLWGGKFSNYTVGLIGTTSSIIGLYQYFVKKQLAKNQ